MKRAIPPSVVQSGHPDHPLLAALRDDITARDPDLSRSFPAMLRRCIDDVIMTPKTGRRSYDALEKTEKTYIGTRVEIELRAMLALPKGRLDTLILGRDVDIKHTMGSNWMIPTEAVGHPCLLVAADEVRARCFLGLVVARRENLTLGQNKDAKKTLSAQGFAQILWLLCHHPYPHNFWSTVPEDAIARIFAGDTGNRRMATLFREVQDRPISRDVVQAVAQQQDFMRRIRSDKGRGTRDHLAREGIALLSGQYDSSLIATLGLRQCGSGDFIAHRLRNENQRALARVHGFSIPEA